MTIEEKKLTKKDFTPDLDVRWCPGCGDYAILSAIQKTFPDLGIPRENFVVVSGIGCSSRFPYYMNTYGIHSIHGRAPSVATGVKVANPDLSVWMITGDGDGLSIGGNHLMHILRRNVDVNILLFNNRIYGLTKGQYSPTSETGKVTKSSPMGSVDYPLNPLSFAMAAGAKFVARTYDTNPKHMVETFKAAAAHKGTSFVEIFQNCVIFNHKTFEPVIGKADRADNVIELQDGQPLRYGKNGEKGIRFNGFDAEKVTLGEGGVTEDQLAVHNAGAVNPTYAHNLATWEYPDMPVPVGVIKQVTGNDSYESMVQAQVNAALEKPGDLQSILTGKDSWEV